MTFTCETRASDNQTWIFSTSVDLSDHITITSVSDVGILWNRRIFDNITANVILSENSVKNRFRVLRSVLNITVLESTSYGSLSVTCFNDELGTATTIIMVVAEPGTYIIILLLYAV